MSILAFLIFLEKEHPYGNNAHGNFHADFHTSKAGVIVIAAMFVIGFIVFKLQAGPVHRVKRAFINEDEDEYEDEDENENDYEIGDMDFAEERF